MRKPLNETPTSLTSRSPANAGVQSDGDTQPRLSPGNAAAHVPERKCILSGKHGARDSLIRLALGPDGEIAPDVRAMAPGRGACIGVDRSTLEASQAKGKLKGPYCRWRWGGKMWYMSLSSTGLPPRVSNTRSTGGALLSD